MITAVTEKGQITIPVYFRRQFGLKKGTKCIFMVRNNELVLVPLKKDMEIEDYQTLFKEGLSSSEEFMAAKQEEKKLEL